MIYCLSCGRGIPEDSKFCTFCGAPTPVVDPKQPNIAANAPERKPVDVSTTQTSKKVSNEFYKDAGFWGALLVIAGFFLPINNFSITSLFDFVKNYTSVDPRTLIWLIFPVTGLVVLLHSLVPGWPGFITSVFIILVFLTLIWLGYELINNRVQYFNSDEISTIVKTTGLGLWFTLAGSILLLFHRRYKKVEIHKTKIIDRTK